MRCARTVTRSRWKYPCPACAGVMAMSTTCCCATSPPRSPSLDEHAWPALVDPTQLTTALLNLAVNARDAMPKGGKLTLETSNVVLDETSSRTYGEVAPGDYVMVAVSDTGSGIHAAIRDKIFDPFFSTKGVGKGTGLGLSMVYRFVKQSGGHIKRLQRGGARHHDQALPAAGERAGGGGRGGRPVVDRGRHGDHPGGRGRCARSQIGHHPDPEPRLPDHLGGERRRSVGGDRARRFLRPAVHRCHHAGLHERT